MAEVWGPLNLSPGQTTHRHIRRLRLWVRREVGRSLFATDLVDGSGVEAVVSEARKSSEVPWQTIVGVDQKEISLSPALPDKPVLLKAPHPVQILPSGELSLVIAVPVWIKLEAGVTILDAETDPMLRTWFGDAQAGESAYALEIEDWMLASAAQRGAAHVHVPLRIRNDSQSLLSFQRLLVRVVHLSIFSEGSTLFTNDVSVTFRSVNQYSQISFSNTSSLDGGGGRLVQEPRERVSDNLIRRSFLFFRGLTE